MLTSHGILHGVGFVPEKVVGVCVHEREGNSVSGQAWLLVVDDEPSLQDIVATSMRFLGYQVSVAGTGRDAVKAAVAEHPDLLILDVMLPDFDGLEVMRRIRQAVVDAGVVFLSARDTPADKVAG